MPQRFYARVDIADRSRFISVQLEQVRLSLDGRAVLRGIDWTIRPGQRWLLTGHNGAGKTLLLKLVAGDLWPTASGGRRRYRYRGERFEEPYGLKQEIAYLGAERQDRYERYGWNYRVEDVVGTGLHRCDIVLEAFTPAERARIARLLRRLGLESLARRRFLTLSYGQRRLVLLARALAAAPKLLLLDELFNGLDAGNRAHALHCLTVLSRTALPWVLSSHRAEEVPALITHRCELAYGSIRSQGRVSGGARRARSATSVAYAPRRNRQTRSAPAARATRADAPALVRLRRASVWRDGVQAVRGLSMQLRAGECWLLHGPNGSGKSSLVQLLYGDLGVAYGGLIERAGTGRGVPIAHFKRRVGLIAPELQAIHPRDLRVDEVVASGLHASIGYPGARLPADRRVRRALRRVGAGALEQRRLRTLSYGQMRRVLFARALVGEPDILLLDEPYAGLDELTRTRLQALVERAVEAGITVMIATHHAQDCPAGATHELELAGGRAVYLGPLRERAGARARGARGV